MCSSGTEFHTDRILSILTKPFNIVVVAVGIRLMFPGTFIFKEDEARALIYAMRIAREHVFLTHTWPSSVGIDNSPIFAYLLSVFAHFSHNPIFVTFCLNLMNLVSVVIAFLIFKKILKVKGEVLLTVLFYAITPVAVHYSRKIWDPVPLPFFTSIMIYSAVKMLYEERSKWILPFVVMIAITTQIHQSGVFFSILVILSLLIHRPKLNYPFLCLGILVGFLLLLPYLTYFVDTGFSQLLNYHRRFGHQFPDIDVVFNFLLNLTGHNIYAVAGHDSVSLLNWPLPGFGAVIGVIMLLFLPPLYYGAAELYSRSSVRFTRKYPFIHVGHAYGYNLFFISIFGLPFLYLIFRVPGVAHYFVVSFPIVFCLIPLGMTRIRARFPGGLLPRSMVLLPILWIVLIAGFLSVTSYRHGGYSFGPTYAFARRIAGDLVTEAAGARKSVHGEESENVPSNQLPEGNLLDSVRVYIHAPKISSKLPEQWKFIFEEEYGISPVLPEEPPYYEITLQWKNKLWSKGSYSIKHIGAEE